MSDHKKLTEYQMKNNGIQISLLKGGLLFFQVVQISLDLRSLINYLYSIIRKYYLILFPSMLILLTLSTQKTGDL